MYQIGHIYIVYLMATITSTSVDSGTSWIPLCSIPIDGGNVRNNIYSNTDKLHSLRAESYMLLMSPAGATVGEIVYGQLLVIV